MTIRTNQRSPSMVPLADQAGLYRLDSLDDWSRKPAGVL
jgi:hypothetical protein